MVYQQVVIMKAQDEKTSIDDNITQLDSEMSKERCPLLTNMNFSLKIRAMLS